MGYLDLNERMLRQRVAENKENKFSEMQINEPGEGFSMLITKEVHKYVDLLEHVTIRDQPILKV